MDAIKTKVQQVVGTVTAAVKPAKSQTILVTGASGFIAAHILNSFFEKGYKVRGTVRSESSAEAVRKSHANYVDQLTFSFVQDVAAPDAFDEAVKGVDGVIHTASPFVMSVENSERDLLDPAIKGTNGILSSIQKNNPDVKRVVITSSFAAIVDMSKGKWPDHTYTEQDWNPVTYDEAKADNGGVAYCASKTFAEKAAYDFIEKKKPNFTVSSICPPMVYGPNAHTVKSMDKLNTSSADIYRLCNGSEKEVPATSFFAFVDVRDVAEAHLRAYESPLAANERFFVTGGNYSYQQICDILRTIPELKDKTPEGTPGSFPEKPVYGVDNSKARTKLGISFTPLEKTIRDAAATLIELEKETGTA